MKTFQKGNSTVRGRALMASWLIGSAIGGIAVPAHAQQTEAPSAPPQLAVTKPLAPQSESLQPPEVQVFQTAPALRQATREAVAANNPVEPNAVEQASPRKFESSGVTIPAQDGPAPWLLDSDTRPWPLSYLDLAPFNTLVFTLPTVREARIMLPGQAADMADRARFTVSRYITDSIGSGSQVRGRQLETFARWAENSTRQKASLPRDDWSVYQFNSELHVTLGAFKAKIEGQTAPALARMAADITAAVTELTPVMDAMGSYEQKLQWYNVLVQLKEGLGLYQARAVEGDQQILAAIDAFELANPRVPRPEGKPPASRSAYAPSVTAAAPDIQAAATAAPLQRTPTQAPVEAEKPTGLGGSVVLAGVAGLIMFFFWRLRKRVANKGLSAKDSSA